MKVQGDLYCWIEKIVLVTKERGDKFWTKNSYTKNKIVTKHHSCDNGYISQSSQDGGLLLTLHTKREALNQTKESKNGRINVGTLGSFWKASTSIL